MAYTKYSLTPSNNNAAPPDGAPEGMLPSAVNDTMRDMMAQIRDCGDGIRGGTYTMTAPVITGGSINGAAIGASSASTGAFTTLAYTGTLTGGTGVIAIGTNQIYKDSSGNLGLGTSSPSQKLDVNGLGRFRFVSGTGAGAWLDTTGNASRFFVGSDAATEGFRIFDSTAGGNRFFINSSGNIGIATNSPVMRLHINEGGVLFGDSATAAYISPLNTNTINSYYGSDTDDNTLWLSYRGFNDGFTRFRSTRIGDGKGNSVLSVTGSTRVVGLDYGQLQFPATQNPSTDGNTLDDYEEGTWTPDLVSTTGTITTVNNGTGYYVKVGRVVTIVCRPVITTNGTGASALRLLGLPFPSSISTQIGGAGREDAVVGWVFGISANTGTSLYIAKYDNTYPGGNGHAFPICITYMTP